MREVRRDPMGRVALKEAGRCPDVKSSFEKSYRTQIQSVKKNHHLVANGLSAELARQWLLITVGQVAGRWFQQFFFRTLMSFHFFWRSENTSATPPAPWGLFSFSPPGRTLAQRRLWTAVTLAHFRHLCGWALPFHRHPLHLCITQCQGTLCDPI